MGPEPRPSAVCAQPLPWLAVPLDRALRSQRGHAILVHGPRGVGQFELSLQLAAAWLCEASERSATPPPACGRCASCKLIAAHSHPDLLVLLPEALRETLGWNRDDGGEAPAESASKAKPSKEIKIAAMRSAIAFAQTTAARGRTKVVLVYPAERINAIASNALLKTLEEPPGDARFVLASSAADALLPTIRSRCHALALPLPDAAAAVAWLRERGVAEPELLLDAAGGQPQEVLDRLAEGIDGAAWRQLPERLARGEAQAFATWPVARLLDALQKLCHDLMRRAAGAAPRFFPLVALAPQPELAALVQWQRDLRRFAMRIEHPLAAPLLIDAMVLGAQQVLRLPGAAKRVQGRAVEPSVHCAR